MNTINVQKSLVQKDKKLILDHLSHEVDELATDFMRKLEEVADTFEKKSSMLVRKARELKQSSEQQSRLLKKEIKELRASLKTTWNEWVVLTRQATELYELGHVH